MAEQQVRENPAKALCRHSLFQLLCVAGDWSRALHQLQLCARMEANYTQEARLYPGVDPAAAQSHPAGWRTGTGGNAHTTGRTERNLV